MKKQKYFSLQFWFFVACYLLPLILMVLGKKNHNDLTSYIIEYSNRLF
ncbi:MAG: hypothetical protein PHT03_07690 [Bacilli bacterium]|nr:hypothetical protein [Bacilli bacterium]MDD4389167.1 hypothetical protein [Bacilli bacterium]